MYDPNYYCAECGKKMGLKSHVVIDRLGESHYEDLYCRPCETKLLNDDCNDDCNDD